MAFRKVSESWETVYRIPAFEVLEKLGVPHGLHADVDVRMAEDLDDDELAEIVITVTEYSQSDDQ